MIEPRAGRAHRDPESFASQTPDGFQSVTRVRHAGPGAGGALPNWQGREVTTSASEGAAHGAKAGTVNTAARAYRRSDLMGIPWP